MGDTGGVLIAQESISKVFSYILPFKDELHQLIHQAISKCINFKHYNLDQSKKTKL